MAPGGTRVWLFSYGTLQQQAVQLATFGRLLEGHPDILFGYALQPLRITDRRVVELSGSDVHSIACRTRRNTDRIVGVAFEISEEELEAADLYEVDAYERAQVRLESGREAFAYVGPPVA